MTRKTLMTRLATLTVATLVCLLLVLLGPLFFSHRNTDEPFPGSQLMASPRDLFVLTSHVRLSEAPDVTLSRAVIYADGDGLEGAPISKIVLDGPVFTFNASGLRSAPVSFESSGPADPATLGPLVEAVARLNFDTLTIRRGTVHVTTSAGTSETIGDVQAELTGRRKGQIAARGSFVVRGQRMAFDAILPSAPDKRTPLRWPAKFSIKGALLEAAFSGHADVAADVRLIGQTEVSAQSLRGVARWFGVPIPSSPGLNKTSIRGQFNWTGRTLAFEDAKVSIDGNEATGALAIKYDGYRPQVEATLAFNALELAPYLEAARAQFFVFDRQTSSWSPFDLSFPIITHVDADLRISAPKVVLSGIGFGSGAASINVQSGRMLAEIAELGVFSGTASGKVTADMNGLHPRFAVRGKIENLDTAQASRAVAGKLLLDGRATLTAELTAAGQTPAAVLTSLAGKASLTMTDAGKMGLDTQALRNAGKSDPIVGWGPLAKAQANVDYMDVHVRIADGVLRSEHAIARSGALGLRASGSVNLVEGSLDVRLASKAGVPTDRPLKPADVAGAQGVTVRGTWSEPIVRVQDDGTRR